MTMRLQHRHSNRYTLVEILVAVAVLVIMMGFLFQFTIGAQRIWVSTTARMTVADQAQGILNLLTDDLGQMVVDDTEGLEIGWYCSPAPKTASVSTPNNLQNLCFYTIERGAGTGSTFAFTRVNYSLVQDATTSLYKLYRTASVVTEPKWDLIGGDAKAPTNTNLIAAVEDDDHLVAENIVSLVIQADTNPDESNPAVGGTDQPRWIKVTVTVRIPEDLRNGENNDADKDKGDRTFTKLFLLEH